MKDNYLDIISKKINLNRRDFIAGGVGALGMAALIGAGAAVNDALGPENHSSSETEGAPTSELGIDIPSWYDQEDLQRLPRSDFGFVVVSIDGGLPTNKNPNLEEQLKWAGDQHEINGYPSVQFYCKATNPRQNEKYTFGTWPRVGDEANKGAAAELNPYEGEVGGLENNNQATNFQYGWNMAEYIVTALEDSSQSVDFSKVKLWIDINILESWQAGSPEAQSCNVAVLEGMAAHFEHVGLQVGLYSKRDQFEAIVGDQIRPDSNLNGLDSWVALGYASEEDAKEELEADKPGLTANSRVVMVQRIEQRFVNNDTINFNYNYLVPRSAN